MQAKDYTNGSSELLARLATFYSYANRLPPGRYVERLIVATSATTRLPADWGRFGAVQRCYSAEEVRSWRAQAKAWVAEQASKEQPATEPASLPRWPHQEACLKACRSFVKKRSQHDFFVQMATGTGKSLVMADLLAELRPGGRACIIVPKLDLMEQMARLLEAARLPGKISRVGTGWPADLEAQVFVSVRNSAWQLAGLNFELLLLDEAHHYEPRPQPEAEELTNGAGKAEARDGNSRSGSRQEAAPLGPHAAAVLGLPAEKRIFFSATLARNLVAYELSTAEFS